MNKKIRVFIAMLVMCVLSLTACTTQEYSSADSTSTQTTTEQVATKNVKDKRTAATKKAEVTTQATTETEAQTVDAANAENAEAEVVQEKVAEAQQNEQPEAVAEAPQVVAEAPAANSGGDALVWIPKNGKKYHSNSSCSNMKNPTQVSKSTAISRGYTPCSKCY